MPIRPLPPLTIFLAVLLTSCAGPQRPAGPEITVRLTPTTLEAIGAMGLQTPVDGRVFLVVTRDDQREPRLQTGVSGVPFFGMDVRAMGSGDIVRLDEEAQGWAGYPFDSLSELPEGDYYVQAVLSVYTTFARSDGHTVSMHLNAGEGQNQWRAPGNAFSTSQRIRLGPGQAVELVLDQVIQPEHPVPAGGSLQQGNPPDTEWVKYVKIRSDLLSDFWGTDMYIGANVLLPAGYDGSQGAYPVIYMQGHFPGDNPPFGFEPGSAGQGRSEGFSEYWASGQAPGAIAVSIRDANPYYDTSYSVNSANLGPYGDAITQELIPHLENTFRIIAQPWARVVAGGSTGGWETIAMQVFYPDYFGGSWGWCPDPLDFNYHQIVNVYEDDNAYFTGSEWHRVERPNARRFDGNIRSTVRQENLMEYATGPQSRSGGQWAIWEAVFGPVGADGYPRPIWDPLSGAIDHQTAAYWRDNFDIHQYLRANWESIAPKLDGKLHIAVGDMDSYYLDNAVYLLEETVTSAAGPRIDMRFEYGRRKPHCWIGYSPTGSGDDLSWREFLDEAAAHMEANRR